MVSNVDMRVGLVDGDVMVYLCPRESIRGSVLVLIKLFGSIIFTDDPAMNSTIHNI